MPLKKKYTFPRPATAADSSQLKQRKPRKSMPRPSGASDAELRAEVARRETVTTDRRRRLDAKKIRDVAAAATVDQEEASRGGMMNPPGHNPHAAWRGRQGVAPATLSPTMPPWGYVPSPGYSKGDAHGNFNPNTTFPHGAPQRSFPTVSAMTRALPHPAFSTTSTPGTTTRRRRTPAASPAPSRRRGVLLFASTLSLQFNYTDADMDEIITSGSVAAA
ncbi:hypothetical protein D1007_05679 [Hordeum vulgare]|nr:hypothetical protein D1007_05679 [Hordeum vulgare]